MSSRADPNVVYHRACRLLLGVLAAWASVAQGAVLDVATHAPERNLTAWTAYLTDSEGTLDIEAVIGQREPWQAIDTPYIDFGFIGDVIWLRTSLENGSDQAVDRLFSFNMRFMQELDVYFVVDGRIIDRFTNDWHSIFEERRIPHRHLVVPFSIPPNTAMDVYVRYWSEGTTAMPMSIETPLSFAEKRGDDNLLHGGFYAFVFVLLLYSVVFSLMTRQRLFAMYALYLGTVATYLAHMDGYTFQFVWPNMPGWNSAGALPLGMLLNIGAAVFSIAFLRTSTRHPKLHRAMLGVIGFTIVYILASFVLPLSGLKQWAFPITGGFAFLFLFSGCYSYLAGHHDTRFYVCGWLGLCAAAVTTTAAHFSEGELLVSMSFEVIRIGIIFDATMMGLGVVDQYNRTRREYNRAQAAARDELARRLDLQNRFLRLEERYHLAHKMANERGLQLAGASHDLRQPLAALRAAIGRHAYADGAAKEDDEQLLQTVGYLESLVSKYIDAANLGAEDTLAAEAPAQELAPAPEVEDFPIAVIFQNLDFMFAQDAEEAGVSLGIRPSSLEVRADPLALMRLLSNTVSNSIRYSPRGSRVVVGCRRKGPGWVRIIVADNGVGMAPEDLEALRQPYARGDHEDRNGFGLGLFLTRQLADENDIDWEVRSAPGRGTMSTFTLPRAAGSSGVAARA